MTTLRLANATKTLIEYKVDLIGSNSGNLTVMDRKIFEDEVTLEKAGLNLQLRETSIAELKTYAETKNIILSRQDQDASPVVLFDDTVELAVTTVQGDVEAIDAKVASSTEIEAVADSTNSLNGKYFTFETAEGGLYYVWFKTSGGVETDPEVADATGIMVSITTDDTAATVAGAIRTALGDVAEVTITGDTVFCIITNDTVGDYANAEDEDTGFTFNNLVVGSDGEDYFLQLEAEGGNTPYTWTLDEEDSLPTGLVLNENGTISGLATSLDEEVCVFTVTDAFGETDTVELTFNGA